MSLCLRCGYDLSHTAIDAPCPECGLAAERSVIEHVSPSDCSPKWVRSVANATLLLLISYVLLVGGLVWFVLNTPDLWLRGLPDIY